MLLSSTPYPTSNFDSSSHSRDVSLGKYTTHTHIQRLSSLSWISGHQSISLAIPILSLLQETYPCEKIPRTYKTLILSLSWTNTLPCSPVYPTSNFQLAFSPWKEAPSRKYSTSLLRRSTKSDKERVQRSYAERSLYRNHSAPLTAPAAKNAKMPPFKIPASRLLCSM